MKKITFVLAFFATALNAQNFPGPYCAIADADEVTVEEITSVDFNGSIISNTNAGVLVDFTSTLVPVTPGQTYSLKVYGDTYGDFDNDIVAFIDWNNNGVLDNDGEVYEIGTLTNTDGGDGIFVDLDIAIPATASEGAKRVRITKIYTDEESVAIINPCAISFDAFGFGAFPGFGQALDFNLDVSSLGSPAFDAKALSVYPVPAKNSLTVAYKSAIGSMQVYNQLGQEIYAGRDLGTEVTVDVSNFASGVYVVKLFSDQEARTFKIIKE